MTGREYYDAIVTSVLSKGNYFKALRPDGWSFMGRPPVQYAVGAMVVPAQTFASGLRLCQAGLLHVSDVPSETLAGGAWPCRLFEVSGEITVGRFRAPHRHKGGATALKVVRELPAWMALGPNGRAAAAFIAMLAGLDPVGRATAPNVVRNEEWDDAWNAARDVTRAAARDAASLAAWAAASKTVWTVRSIAWAIVVADLITPKQFATLYAPIEMLLPITNVRQRGIKMFPIEIAT